MGEGTMKSQTFGVVAAVGLLILASGWHGHGTAVTYQKLDPALPPPVPGTIPLPAMPIVAGKVAVGYLPATSDVLPTGTYSYSIPLDVPAGRNAMEPSLSIVYTSGKGNGLLGVGFSLGGEVTSTITRCHKAIASEGISDGIDYDPPGAGSDAFCLDGNKLVAVNGSYGGHGTEYRTEHEIFAQIVSYHGGNANAPERFVVKLKNVSALTPPRGLHVTRPPRLATPPSPGRSTSAGRSPRKKIAAGTRSSTPGRSSRWPVPMVSTASAFAPRRSLTPRTRRVFRRSARLRLPTKTAATGRCSGGSRAFAFWRTSGSRRSPWRRHRPRQPYPCGSTSSTTARASFRATHCCSA
jgi:Salmonella virulence plasmid 65kDa B protein